ncbi:histidine kinase N-terminal 7TM domain-containing protein [Haloarcula sp. KBTZ06]|uniref:histidine kinase N-terminal 7TM domain-containing protein n=1 Tax=Haloarcula TaxID=2237 RepID=UPI000595578B|nr:MULTISPECIES: histidine kinase N-terminal 7TM domain-containing protein [Haloarcula]AJF27221.1 chemotaxis protein CheY [Haloarcula sp. CBA1115]KAA9406970.1 PAS domain-containing protein [Haloarcula sp. CBA1131]KZX48766.1 PAS domain-containing sensor histidine kinase [Haloarcula sp. K1]
MATLLVAYAFSLLVVAVVLGTLSVYAWSRRDSPGGTALSVLLAGLSIWDLCAAVGVLTRGTELALFFAYGLYVGVMPAMAGLFVFALAYTGRDRYLGWRAVALLAVEPLVFFAALFVGPDGAIYAISGPTDAGMYGWEITPGPVFWGHLVYSYALIAVSSALLIHYALVSGGLYRKQVYAVLLAIVLPWFGSVVSIFGDTAIEFTPLLLAGTGLTLSWAFFKGRLLDISPVAYREVVESLNSAVFVVDTDDTIIEANDVGRQLLGDEDIVGKSVEDALETSPKLLEKYRGLNDDAEETQAVIEQRDRFFDVQLTPLYDSHDALVGRVFLVHEITEQKERERELERRNQQLDQFAAVLSHDLRNPLNVASGRLALARERNDPEEFDRVEEAHDRMSSLIDEVLAFARDEKTTDRVELQLSALAKAAWGHVDTGKATLRIDGDREIIGDRDQLLQLFENVVRNSVEHGSTGSRPDADDSADHGHSRTGSDDSVAHGGAGVTIRVDATPDGFTISDNGPGVPPEEREEVFTHGVTSSESGTGLGLAIVQHVVESHGWDVEMTESRSGGAKLVISGLETRSTQLSETPS